MKIAWCTAHPDKRASAPRGLVVTNALGALTGADVTVFVPPGYGTGSSTVELDERASLHDFDMVFHVLGDDTAANHYLIDLVARSGGVVLFTGASLTTLANSMWHRLEPALRSHYRTLFGDERGEARLACRLLFIHLAMSGASGVVTDSETGSQAIHDDFIGDVAALAPPPAAAGDRPTAAYAEALLRFSARMGATERRARLAGRLTATLHRCGFGADDPITTTVCDAAYELFGATPNKPEIIYP